MIETEAREKRTEGGAAAGKGHFKQQKQTNSDNTSNL